MTYHDWRHSAANGRLCSDCNADEYMALGVGYSRRGLHHNAIEAFLSAWEIYGLARQDILAFWAWDLYVSEASQIRPTPPANVSALVD